MAPTVTVTHPERVLFPEDGITKGDLVQYYRDVAQALLPYTEGRPLTLQRWPGGIEGPSFFEKQTPRGAPPFIATTRQPKADGHGWVDYPLCNDAASLAWCANLSAITLHVWMSRASAPDEPTFLLFDLDPFEGCTIATLARVAATLREELAFVGMEALVKTTGGKGLHVVVPLAAGYSYEQAHAFNEVVALHLARELPGAVTLERSLAKRPGGAVYFDWAQLGKGKLARWGEPRVARVGGSRRSR